MLGYVATLEGFKDGVEYYIVPDDWGKMLEIEVWVRNKFQKNPDPFYVTQEAQFPDIYT